MKSRISFFNAPLSRDILRRCWPLWAAYLGVLLLMLPLRVAGEAQWVYADGSRPDLNRTVLQLAEPTVVLAFFAAILTAMVMFGYLYNSRSCGRMHALPLRRETVFLTTCLTGILPLLAADLLIALLTGLLFCARGLSLNALISWLLTAVLSKLSFYGFACFCALLTGNLLVLPAVYVVLSFAVYVAENCARSVLTHFVYGMRYFERTVLDFLSPPVYIMGRLRLFQDPSTGLCELRGLGMLAAYAGVGLVLTALALVLYRRRNMETAGDVVAIPVLKPIFKYCLSFGCALVLVWGMDQFAGTSLFDRLWGWGAALMALGLMLLGAFLGYFAAEMLIQKSLQVFRGKWKGFAAVCLVLSVFVVLWELDVFGYERRVPEPSEVRAVLVDRLELEDPENVRAMTELHRMLIEQKAESEPTQSLNAGVELRYLMKDGSTLVRYYPIDHDEAAMNDPDSAFGRWEALFNCREARRLRTSFRIEPREENIMSFYLSWTLPENGISAQKTLYFTPAQAMDFIENAMKPDAEAGTLGRRELAETEEYLDTATNLSIALEIRDASTREQDPTGAVPWDSFYLTLYTDSANCLRWIEENAQVEILTQRELKQALEAERGALGRLG